MPGNREPKLCKAGTSPIARFDAPRLVRRSGIIVLVDIRENASGYPKASTKNRA